MFLCPIGNDKCSCWLSSFQQETVYKGRIIKKTSGLPYPMGHMVRVEGNTGYVNRVRTINNIVIVRVLWFKDNNIVIKEYPLNVIDQMYNLYCNFYELPVINWRMLYFSWKHPGIIKSVKTLLYSPLMSHKRKRRIVESENELYKRTHIDYEKCVMDRVPYIF